MDCADLEGIALDIHVAAGERLPVDAFVLATQCGLELRPWRKPHGLLSLDSEAIYYPSTARPARQHGVVAHELGHWAMHRAGEDHTQEWAARYLAGALLLPRMPFLRDVRATDWDLHQLQRLHPNASAEMIVVRMTQVSDACAWVWDDGAVRRRYGATDDESVEAIVDRVLASEAPERVDDMRAWPMLERGHRRVVVVRLAA